MTRVLAASRLLRLIGEIDRDPAYAGLARGIRASIADGRVPVGVRLPSERDLTEALGVSRTTVARAYAELRDLGYLRSRQGSGSVATLPDGVGHRGDHLLAPHAGDVDGLIDLTCAAPAPLPGVLEAYRRAVEHLPDHLTGAGYFPSGTAGLRREVARHYADRGLPTEPDQVVVVPGALAGLAVAARALLRPGDRVLVESPTYPNAIAALERSGGRLLGCEPDAAAVAAGVRQVRPRAAYLVPDFHNPTGRLLTAAERAGVADALRATGTVALADESVVSLHLDDRPAPTPMALHAPDTISIGSASKTFWGGLRVGWLRVPEARLEAVIASRLSLDLGVPVLEQLVATDLLAQAPTLLAQRRAQLRASRDALVDALGSRLPDWRFRTPRGGLVLWCELPEARSTTLAGCAARHGVALAPGPAFAPEGGLDRFVRLPYVHSPEVMHEAVERLAQAWSQAQAPGQRGTAPSPTLVA